MSRDQEEGRANLVRKWATVVAADVVGYSRLIGDDAQATVTDLDILRGIVKSQTESSGGYIADISGDAIICVFDTALGALYAATAAQREIGLRSETSPEDRKMLLRMGLHIDELFEKSDGTVYGNCVNIAARIEGLAPEGGVAVSHQVKAACGPAHEKDFFDQGDFDAKNVAQPIRVHIYSPDGDIATIGTTAKMSRSVAKGNLPGRATALIGREDALVELTAHLQSSRLVTLLGMGGLGKTSLSIATAHSVAAAYPDGAWFVDLAAISDADTLTLAISGLFGVTQQSGKSMEESLVEALRARQMLLIFDNCEHVTTVAAKLVNSLLTSCPKVSIIATSRELLSISGEEVMHIMPLDVSGGASHAVELFAERARAVSPGFAIEQYRAHVQEICESLDGIPLAIELAAARAKSMSPAQIRDRLDQRFRLLTGGSRAVRERHQTLRNAVQWSYDLLTESESMVLDRASVFAGGFSLEAAEIVCAGVDVDSFDVVDIIDSLVSKSLLTVLRDGDSIRYGILETIRAFGAERLAAGEQDRSVRLAHANFYADQSDDNFKLWRSSNQIQAHNWLDLEINNLRVAFRWANVNKEIDPAARIASSVGDMARFRLREEAANWAEDVVDSARSESHPRLAILLTWCASSAWAIGRFEDAQRFGDEALLLLEDEAFEPFVWAYGDLAFVAIFSGDVDKAIELLAIGASHPADRLDRFMMAFHLYILATAGHADKALFIADDVVSHVDSAGVPMSIAVAHAARGAALEATDPEAALKEYEFGIEVASRAGVTFMETLIAPKLAALHGKSGEPRFALEGFERMLSVYGDTTDMASVFAWRTALVILFAKTEQYHAVATLHGTLIKQIDQDSVTPEHTDAIARANSALGMKAFTQATVNGSEMSLREATNYAVAQVNIGLETLDVMGTRNG
ncbi:adenylate/guanylate cyclase domain-containing protein [Granulosicoccus sp.]|nr:adenylate/guanylate cyclase domain-containing protein [Granulosicoccus sp.]MDB4224085.1 adenylate/guanylate cyclase domain-containing protein [Granulosicoccus sp.]